MGGGKSSTQTNTVELPEELEQGAVGALGGALQSASLPYAPNRGVTIAGFSPQQQAAFSGANAASSAFGLGVGNQPYLPQQEMGAGGVRGYSTGALFDQNVDRSMTAEDQANRERILRNFGTIGNEIMRGETVGDMPVQSVSNGYMKPPPIKAAVGGTGGGGK